MRGWTCKFVVVLVVMLLVLLWTGMPGIPSSPRSTPCHSPQWREADSLSRFPAQPPPLAADAAAHVGRSACGLRFATFVVHTLNWNLTEHVVRNLARDPHAHVHVLDASWAEETRSHAAFFAQHRVVPLYPHLPLSLAQAMEYIRRVALTWELDMIVYAHNDAVFAILISVFHFQICIRTTMTTRAQSFD